MKVVVTYDVSTLDAKGRRRLRRVAQACKDFGQRVQQSVFEVEVNTTQWAILRGRLLEEFEAGQDSLRFYFLGEDSARRTEHHGRGVAVDFTGPLVV